MIWHVFCLDQIKIRLRTPMPRFPDLLQRLQSALWRVLPRNARFSVTVVLILGLGIGINVATLGLLYRYYVSPLPWPGGNRVTSVYFTSNQAWHKAMSIPVWQRLKKEAPALSSSGLYRPRGYNLALGSQTERLNGAVATASIFTTLGVHPALGRFFGAAADQPGAKPVVVLSYSLWHSLFDGARSAIGKALRLDGKLFTVIGVMPKGFNFPTAQAALWTPRTILPSEKEADMLTALHDQMIGRLAPGASLHAFLTQANAALKKEIANFPYPKVIPEFRKLDFRIGAKSWRESRLENLHQTLTLVQFATALLMLLVWFNLANLFLARTFSRRSELTLRRILGAGAATLATTMARENLVLSLLGAFLGVFLGRFLLTLFAQSGIAGAASSIPGTSWPVMLSIALLLGVISAVIFTVVGIGFLHSRNLVAVLGENGNRTAQSPVARRLRISLLVSQIALACALAGCGLLLGRSLMNLNAVKLGFSPSHVETFKLDFPEARFSLETMLTAIGHLRQTIRQQPGMDAVSVTSDVPFDGASGGYTVSPRPAKPDSSGVTVFPIATDNGYLKTMGLTLLSGRNFQPTDTREQASVAIVDTLAAQQLFGTRDAVGHEFSFDNSHTKRRGLLFRVIGVVSNARRTNLGSAPATGNIYVDASQIVGLYKNWSWGIRAWYLSVRSSLPASTVVSQVKRAEHKLLPDIPLYDIRTMGHRVAHALQSNRLLTLLVGLFAFGALLLAAIGLYAVQAYAVAQRAREFAIRIALGAERGRLLALVLGEAARLLVIGLVIGLVGLAFIGLAFASAFYGISPVDPVSMIVVAAVLCCATLGASWLPAWRASRTTPSNALRN